jgi:kynurenine formamidase
MIGGLRLTPLFLLAFLSLASAEEIAVDLTHDFSSDTVYWPTSKQFQLEEVYQGKTEGGYYYAANNFGAAEHGGTHLDAPLHFAEGRQGVEQIPLESLIGEAIVVDVSGKVAKGRDYQISIQDLNGWEIEHGRIPEDALVLLRTGFGAHWPDPEKYLGTAERGERALRKLHFPGLAPEAAQWLVENRKIKAVGIDTASIDYGQSESFQSHQILASQNIPIFENLANLDELPPLDFKVFALPMKIKGGSGAPLRAMALVTKKDE